MNNHGDGTTLRHGMKAKTIRMIMRKKVNAWLETIKDNELRNKCRKEAIVTGGSIASMLLGEEVNDFDIYFRTKETVKAVADYYVSEFEKKRKKQGGIEIQTYVEELEDTRGKDRVRIVVKSAGIVKDDESPDYDYFEARAPAEAGDYLSEVMDNLTGVDGELTKGVDLDADEYTPAFLSSNAISLRGKVQLILRFYGEPDEIHESYDFAHCMNYWESCTGHLTLRPDSLEALLSRTLTYKGSQYPLCSIIRSRKFVQRGWRINAGQYVKMAMQLNDLELTNFDVLEEQLTGVDVAYFQEVIGKLKEKDMKSVDSAYLIELIDRMF